MARVYKRRPTYKTDQSIIPSNNLTTFLSTYSCPWAIDPELWRDIQANVRKMDDLYDATFYTWLRSEDNVLVTASYLQRLAGEYQLERIEHALCWLVNGWRLESIAILVKQVTFDWVATKGDQGEMNRAKLVLALTDNWAIQYIARLACTLLTSATIPSPPPPLIKFMPTHSRMSSMPGSPMTMPSHGMATTMFSTEGHPHRSLLATVPAATAAATLTASRPSTPPLSTRSSTASSPSSPSFSLTTSPVLSTLTPQSAHGRRMAVSRRLGSPMHMSGAAVEDAALQLGRPPSVAGSLSPGLSLGSRRSGHFRQTSSTFPVQQPRQQQDHTQQGTLSVNPLHSSSAASLSSSSSSAAVSVYPSQQQASYHPHHCTLSHHHHPQQQQQQQQQRGVALPTSTSQSHTRQQSQPGTISASKQHWLQQQSSYSSTPVFYMNKSLFMEELSRKWSFCRLSEFFQCMDPASGISHRFKCKLLKESALKEEMSHQQTGAAGKNSSAISQSDSQKQSQQDGHSCNTSKDVQTADSRTSTSMIQASSNSADNARDSTDDIVMAECDEQDAIFLSTSSSSSSSVSSSSSSSSSTWSSLSIHQTANTVHADQTSREPMSLHPFDNCGDNVAVTAHDSRTASMSDTTHMVQMPHEQAQYHPSQPYPYGEYNDDMHSGLNRGCKSSDAGHQHCRAQTVQAIMSGGLGVAGPRVSSSSSSSSLSSSSSSSAASPTSTSAASASLSTLTLTESGLEPTARPMSQPQSQQHQPQHHQPLSPFASNYSTPGLYRHATTLSTASVSATIPSSSATVATSSSATTLTIHSSAGQRHAHDSTSTKRKNSLGVSLAPSSHCSTFSSTSSTGASHSSAESSLSSSSAIFPGARRTSTSTSTTNEDLKRLRCSRQNSTSSTSGI
ncbi:hypothetical protein EDD11_009617 [Mortierella claussenii]|nr:hypothetical protein EDD11_009617 [Mortierella claussenii]